MKNREYVNFRIQFDERRSEYKDLCSYIAQIVKDKVDDDTFSLSEFSSSISEKLNMTKTSGYYYVSGVKKGKIYGTCSTLGIYHNGIIQLNRLMILLNELKVEPEVMDDVVKRLKEFDPRTPISSQKHL